MTEKDLWATLLQVLPRITLIRKDVLVKENGVPGQHVVHLVYMDQMEFYPREVQVFPYRKDNAGKTYVYA